MSDKIIKMYNTFIECSDNDDMFDPKKVGWNNKYAQDSRFAALLAIGVKPGDKILDYGCGLGHLINFLQIKNIDVDYTGIDINEKYIQIAKDIFTDSNLKVGDIEGENCVYDWALASGVFTYGLTKEEIFGKISEILTKVSKGFAFNFLLKSEAFIEMGFNCYDPHEMLSELKSQHQNVYLIQGYTNDDFTIFITKEPLKI